MIWQRIFFFSILVAVIINIFLNKYCLIYLSFYYFRNYFCWVINWSVNAAVLTLVPLHDIIVPGTDSRSVSIYICKYSFELILTVQFSFLMAASQPVVWLHMTAMWTPFSIIIFSSLLERYLSMIFSCIFQLKLLASNCLDNSLCIFCWSVSCDFGRYEMR